MARIFRRDDEILRETGARRARFTPVDSGEDLDAVVRESAGGTAFLFLHDPYCPISSSAFEEVEQVDATVYLLDVSSHSRLGKEVERRTGIRHESPQAIVFRDGVPAWHASHGRIKAPALRAALGLG